MEKKIKPNYADKIESKKDLIFVKEYTKDHEHNGWMDKETYKDFYSETELNLVEKEGVHGDAIGQGKWMFSKTFDKVMQDYENNLYNIERDKEKELESYKYCVKTHGKKDCTPILTRLSQAKKDMIQFKKEHNALFDLPAIRWNKSDKNPLND